MPNVPRISESEWEVLSVLWKEAPLTAAQVFERLADRQWKLTTVRTFLARLEKKGAVVAREASEAKVFSAAITREACVRREGESFLNRVFEGGTGALLTHFAKSRPLSEGELAELEAILNQKRKETKRERRKSV